MNNKSLKALFTKPRTTQDNPGGFSCNPGNGQNIPVYELDENDRVVRKLDENKKPVFHNLTAEIQLFKHSNDYKKLIEQNGSLDVLEQASANEYIDTTKFGTAAEVLNAAAKIKQSGVSLEQWIDLYRKQYGPKVVNGQENGQKPQNNGQDMQKGGQNPENKGLEPEKSKENDKK